MVRLLSSILGCLAIAGTAAAQVRVEAQPGAMVDPASSAATQQLFERSGIFMIAGGVLPDGHAAFLREQGGIDQPIPASSITPAIDPAYGVALRAGGMLYRVTMPAGLACPLGMFVARDGIIAYTVPRYADPQSRWLMAEMGLVRHHIAREFYGTAFVPLLRAADFGATKPASPILATQIMAGINRANGLPALVSEASLSDDDLIGSYINSGSQVTYRVYLNPQSHSADIGGVPLRYFWKLDRSGAAAVFAVELYAQDWPANAHLTDLTAKDAKPTQYDVVNFFQVAALFRQLHASNTAAFTDFVAQACSRKL